VIAFVIALVGAVLAIGAYAHYNPGAHDVTLRTYHFAAIPDWVPAAVVAGGVLLLFLLHSLYARRRIRRLRLAVGGPPLEDRQSILERWAADRRSAEDY
jgi:hypothetical protein